MVVMTGQIADEFEEGAVLLVERTYKSGKTYSFAAIKTNGLWYLTDYTLKQAIDTATFLKWLGPHAYTEGIARVYWAEEVVEI